MAAPLIYHVGHEGFFAMAPETTDPIAPNSTTIPTVPTGFKLVGYTDLPDIANDCGAQGVKTAAAYQEVDAYQTQNEYAFNGELTLCANALTNTLIGAACRSNSETWSKTALGLPLICIATGFINDYGGTRAETTLGRHALVNRMQISAREKSPLLATFEIWPQYIADGAAQSSAIGGDVEGDSLFHEALTWNTFGLTIGGETYRHVIAGVDIDISNNLVRQGVRPIYPSGASAPLSLTPYSILPGTQTSTLQLQLHTAIAPELKAREVGEIIMTAKGYYGATEKTLTLTIPNATFSQGSRDRAKPDDPIMYSASFLARNVTAAWS